MADKKILIDTSVLIDYYRKTDKVNSVWMSLVRQEYDFAVSAISKYEIYSGATQNQLNFWSEVFHAIQVIPFDDFTADTAVNINSDLKRKRKQIDIADLFIAATAISNNLSIATLNRKHFNRIETLNILP
jgi:predicted nucleic acid-binding protein